MAARPDRHHAAMAAVGCRSKVPAATLSTARARTWPTKNAAKLVTSPTTKVTAAKTSDLAASTRSHVRRGNVRRPGGHAAGSYMTEMVTQ